MAVMCKLRTWERALVAATPLRYATAPHSAAAVVAVANPSLLIAVLAFVVMTADSARDGTDERMGETINDRARTRCASKFARSRLLQRASRSNVGMRRERLSTCCDLLPSRQRQEFAQVGCQRSRTAASTDPTHADIYAILHFHTRLLFNQFLLD